MAAPQLAIQLFSDAPQKWDLHSHYGGPVVPMFAAAAALSLVFLPSAKRGRAIAAGGWLLLVLAFGVRDPPWPAGRGKPIDPEFSGSKRALALARAVDL